MDRETLYERLDEAWDREDYNALIDIYSRLIDEWEPDQPLHYSGLATAQLFSGQIDAASETLRYLDEKVGIDDKDARKDRDLAYGYLYAERAFLCFRGVDQEGGIQYRYPTTEQEVDSAQRWLERARAVSARDAYLKDQLSTLDKILTAYQKENKKRIFAGSKPVAVVGTLLALLALIYAFNVYPATTSSEHLERVRHIRENTIAFVAKVIEEPGAAGRDVIAFCRGFVRDFEHHIQFFWPGLLYLVSAVVYIVAGSMPAGRAQTALNAKHNKAQGRWVEVKQAMSTKNTYHTETTTTRYSDGSTRVSSRRVSDDAQGRAIRAVGTGHFLSFVLRVVFLPITVLLFVVRYRRNG